MINERKRVESWRAAFDKEADKLRRIPFEWGTHDCAIGLVANMTKAITGEDKAKKYRGKYNDSKSAFRLMRKQGFTDLADMAASMLPEIHPSQTQIGDIVAIKSDTEFKHALGVVNGERVLVLREDGMGTVDLSEAVRAFRVG